MPSLQTVRNANSEFSPNYLPCAIFLGGTGGIGHGTARAFARSTNGNAQIFIVGRNQKAADDLIASFPKHTAHGAKHEFIHCDATLMTNVSALTEHFLARLDKVNFIVTSTAFVSHFAREETSEGIDSKMALLFYARWKIVLDLLPLLKVATERGEDTKVLTVLAAGVGGPLDRENLGLRKDYSMTGNVKMQVPTYTNLVMEDLALKHPKMTFVQTHPGFVVTELTNHGANVWFKLAGCAAVLLGSVFGTSSDDAGEYTLYGLLQSGPGPKWVGNRGDDLGDWDHGSDEERRILLQHLKDSVTSK